MNLGFTKKKLMSIILLLGCIFISLAMSHIPFLISKHKAGINIEGLDDGLVEDDEEDVLEEDTAEDTEEDIITPTETTAATDVTTNAPAVTTVAPTGTTVAPVDTIKPQNVCSSSLLLSAKLLLDNMDYVGARSILNSCN